jgi:uncharacterized membrane protein YgdD (TMEM256/DUF423 family)
MHKKFISIAAIITAIAVLLGAFGAHALKEKLSLENLQTFETGVRYQFYHAFALLAVGILYKEIDSRLLKWAGWFFIGGIILFSGSLYVLSCWQNMRWVGVITPFGGLSFITGWILLAVASIKNQERFREG